MKAARTTLWSGSPDELDAWANAVNERVKPMATGMPGNLGAHFSLTASLAPKTSNRSAEITSLTAQPKASPSCSAISPRRRRRRDAVAGVVSTTEVLQSKHSFQRARA